jgi:hypothetical protein
MLRYAPGAPLLRRKHARGVIGSGAGQDITTDLFAYWKFDETSGTTAADSSGNGNTLNVSYTSFVPAKINNGLELDAVGYPQFPSFGETGDITIAFWAKPVTLTNTALMIFIGNYSNFAPCINCVTGVVGFCAQEYFEPTLLSNYEITTTDFVHIALVRKDTTIYLYINGSLNATLTDAPSLSGPFNYIGCSGGQVCILDELRLYTRALTAPQIAAVYAYAG